MSKNISMAIGVLLMAAGLLSPAASHSLVLEDMQNITDLKVTLKKGKSRKADVRTIKGRDGAPAVRVHCDLDQVVRLEKDFVGSGVVFGDYDLLKFDCKLEGGPVYLVVYLADNDFAKNYEVDWYVLDSATMPFDWQTITIDLHWPEEVKAQLEAGTSQIKIEVKPYRLDRSDEKPYRTVSLGAMRLMRKSIDVTWNQTHAPYHTTPSGDLVASYELKVKNLTGQAQTIRGRLNRQELKLAKANFAEGPETSFELAANEERTVSLTLALDQRDLASLSPLYCERVTPVFSLDGVPHSDTPIVSSSDYLPLSITVPLSEMGAPPFITEYVLHSSYDGRFVKKMSETVYAGTWSPVDEKGRVAPKPDWCQNGEMVQYLASEYVKTKDRKFADAARKVILAYAHEYDRRRGILRDRDNWGVQTIHATRFNSTTLGAGWFMRPLLTGYDALYQRGVFSAQEKQFIDEKFVLPIAITMRNHLIGLGNMQSEVNFVVTYAGLLTNNLPLVSFAYSSKEGLKNQILYNFSEDGFASEGHYHAAVLHPLVQHAELLANLGVNVYDDNMRRLFDAYCEKLPMPNTHKIHLDIAHRRYGDEIYEIYHNGGYPENLRAGHLAHYGYTILRHRWQGDVRAAAVNWAHQEMRSSPDRMTIQYFANGRVRMGARRYNKKSLSQSTILVDMMNQDPQRGQVDYLDRDGDVQVVSVSTKKDAPLYAGVRIHRSLILIRGCLLLVDRAVSTNAHHYDHVLYYQDGATTTLPLSPATDNWGHQGVSDAQVAASSSVWQIADGDLRTTFLGGEGMSVLLGKQVDHNYAKRRLLLQRVVGDVADWISFTEMVDNSKPRMQKLERLNATVNNHIHKDAFGIRFELDGKPVTVLVNYSDGEASVDGLKTRARIAVAGLR